MRYYHHAGEANSYLKNREGVPMGREASLMGYERDSGGYIVSVGGTDVAKSCCASCAKGGPCSGSAMSGFDSEAVPLLEKAAVAAAAYHGWKRNGEVIWALAWAGAAVLAPWITVGVAVAQGFSKPKKGSWAEMRAF